ncbi:hypothetical protein [Paenibacillus sp. FSL K6-2524]|uniref:hypothetical protein n=1 Tax=Paenibacillus sp. FSL K6-2524 TaxID=2954516 RepID=UPI0030F5356B
MRNDKKWKEDTSFINMEVIRNAKEQYGLTDEETFRMFIAPALDEAVRNAKIFRFPFRPDLPIDDEGNYSKEWMYLRDRYGYTSCHQESTGIWVLDRENEVPSNI